MTQMREALCALWRVARNRPAWLSLLVERLKLDAEDEAYLNDIEDAFLQSIKEVQESWRRDVANRIRNVSEEADGTWARERRKEYLTLKYRSLSQEIEGLRSKQLEESPSETTRMFNQLCVQELEHRRSRLSWELRALSGHGGSGLKPGEIEKAREFPLENLVETKRGMMICPLHDDKHPSMLVKNGFGYCFSCGGYLDSIGFLMRVRGLRFREAVEALQ